jgi:meiotic recombination protein REC8
MSPADHLLLAGTPSPASLAPFHGDLNIPRSSSKASNQLQMPFPFGSLGSLPADKNVGFNDDEQFPVFEDWGIMVDEDGNLKSIGDEDEPQLPVLPESQVVVPDEDGLPRVLSSPTRQRGSIKKGHQPALDHHLDQQGTPHQPQDEQLGDSIVVEEVSSQVQATARKRKQRRPQTFEADERTTLTMAEIKGWNNNYLKRVKQYQDAHSGPSKALAEKNAYNLMFGYGIADIGAPNGIPNFTHPLAELFAGKTFKNQLLGLDGVVEDQSQGHRRSSSQAQLDDNSPRRRVRARLSDQVDDLVGRGLASQKEELLYLPDPEMGRHGGLTLPDLPSDVPWNRLSSQIPSSTGKGSVKLTGQLGGRHMTSSPLQNRGSMLPELERFSDVQVFGSDDLGSFGGQQYLDGFNPDFPGQAAHVGPSPGVGDFLDHESDNFIAFVEIAARKKGVERGDKRRWVKFDDLFEPDEGTRHRAVMAFYHVLSLATKDVLKVDQDINHFMPFQEIHLGVILPPIAEERDDGDKEKAHKLTPEQVNF